MSKNKENIHISKNIQEYTSNHTIKTPVINQCYAPVKTIRKVSQPVMDNKWIYSSPSGGQGAEKDSKLVMSGSPLSFGVYRTGIPIKGDWVRLEAECRFENLASPKTAITVMLSFFRDDKTPIRRQYIHPEDDESEGKLFFSRLLEIPEETTYCEIDLALRWPRKGSVTFDEPKLIICEPPEERIARVVVTYFNHQSNPGNLSWHDRINSMFDKLSACDPDLICFCEMVQGMKPEPIDGPFATLLSKNAKKCNSYVIGNFMELEGDIKFNTSILLDRKGELVGKYRKTHLPLCEVEDGVSPGDTYPVFETDFGRVGMLICWDISFPETIYKLRQNGAELAVNSTVGDFWPQDPVRARDNGIWVAVAGSHRLAPAPVPPSRIFNPLGTLVAATGEESTDSFTYADIDFNRCFYQYWCSVGPCDGEPPSLYQIERRPETY